MKIYSGIYDEFHPFDMFFPKTQLVVANGPNDLDGPGILIIHGGADISPSMYNKRPSKQTYAGVAMSYRDKAEWALMQEAKQQGILIMGICRGAQMLCALSGGYLIQHVNNHSGTHNVVDSTGVEFQVNSIHHQMQAPWDIPHEMLATTVNPRSTEYWDEDKTITVPNEPEAVWYPETRGMAVQWHPEMMLHNLPANKWLQSQLEKRYA